MDMSVLIVADAEGFMVKGIETKLKGVNAEAAYASFNLKELQRQSKDKSLFIILTNDLSEDTADALVYIKDYCEENNKQVITIGKKDEYEFLKKYIPDKFLFKSFERPLDMGQLLNEVENYMEKESAHMRKKNILIVDDDVSYMALIMDWLKDTYRVSLANSGMQAITWLATNHADLILLDYEMPVVTGAMVLEMIKSEASTSQIPVMFLTGKGDKESIMRVLALKPAGYLLKTIDKAGLLESLYNFFYADMQKDL